MDSARAAGRQSTQVATFHRRQGLDPGDHGAVMCRQRVKRFIRSLRVKDTMTNPAVRELLERSNRLGADPRNTNYPRGNTSAKGSETHPAPGGPGRVIW